MNTMLYVNPIQEPDESRRERMTFFNPFNAEVLEGAPNSLVDADNEVATVAILSAN